MARLAYSGRIGPGSLRGLPSLCASLFSNIVTSFLALPICPTNFEESLQWSSTQESFFLTLHTAFLSIPLLCSPNCLVPGVTPQQGNSPRTSSL